MPQTGSSGQNVPLTPVTSTTGFFKSIQDILGTTQVYLQGTVFRDDGNGTATPLDSNGVPLQDIMPLDAKFFVAFDPDAPWQAEAGIEFWTINQFGGAMSAIWDGTTNGEPMARLQELIGAGWAFKTQAAITNFLATLNSATKDTP